VILLDTNVISELIRAAPVQNVQQFVLAQPPESVFTSAVCEAEIRYGLARLPHGHRRQALTDRVIAFLSEGFAGQILPFDSVCASWFAEVRAARDAVGKPISLPDAMIAATARAHGATVATRNLADFAACGIEVVNPWEYR